MDLQERAELIKFIQTDREIDRREMRELLAGLLAGRTLI